ncbi:MAG TPA: c-type cytochrome [Arcobacter sp.]|nr:c-type cytochrome [Arcobacter sp.]HIP55965.1 c-type cytochrome [Arcobacter sp.]
MKSLYILPIIALLFTACFEEPVEVDAKKLLETTCAKCHNLSMPPQIPQIELAPPMMAVTFHIKDFIKTANPSEHKIKFSSFVSNYVLNPSLEKSYCDKASIKKYGLMKSLKGEITSNEATQIAAYMYDKYDAKKFYKNIKIKEEFEALEKGEQIAKLNSCMSCHDISKKKIAPSFKTIAKQSNKKDILYTLLNGSKGKYKGFEKSYMPPLGKSICKKDLEELSSWILSL